MQPRHRARLLVTSSVHYHRTPGKFTTLASALGAVIAVAAEPVRAQTFSITNFNVASPGSRTVQFNADITSNGSDNDNASVDWSFTSTPTPDAENVP